MSWVCSSQGNFGRGVTGLGEDGHVCYMLKQGVLLCNVFSLNSEVCENPTDVGLGFSLQLG